MELRPKGYEKVLQLMERGAIVHDPLSLTIADEVDVGRIATAGVTFYPGCRIYGAKTVISAGCVLGAEGPVTLEDCRLGLDVQLKGGYFRQSVFLEKAGMGSGAQVREACLLEEEANGAHCVGLKQTILMPFVTLGSLVNFCDCLLGGGTSRTDHSEVGSSYVHFNYTPDGDKTTASLFGDVPRGVMLDQRPIFLGGQGGAVGPVRVGYGTVVAAGSILRHDVLEDGRLVSAAPPPGFQREHRPHACNHLIRMVRNNIIYLANLAALEQWYQKVRGPFFAQQDLGDLVYEGALEVFLLAKDERSKRLLTMAEGVPNATDAGREWRARVREVCAVFREDPPLPDGAEFFAAFDPVAAASKAGYVETIRAFTPALRSAGVEWLGDIVGTLCREVGKLLPSMSLFEGRETV